MSTDEAARLLVEAIETIRAERILRVELEADRDAYRDLACAALAELSTLTARVRSQADTIARLHRIVRDYVQPRERAA